MKELIMRLFGIDKDIIRLNSEVDTLIKEINDLNNVVDAKDRDINFKMSKIDYLEKELNQTKDTLEYTNKMLTTSEDDLENYLNHKYPMTYRSYIRYDTTGSYNIDVRNYFQPYDNNLPKVSGKTFDAVALNCLKYVIDNIEYMGDAESTGFAEYWQYAYQTLSLKKGDCEDGAILLANMMLYNGIPYYRIRLNAGSVRGGGHAYVSYCRETDNQWVVLDWCYWPNKKPIKDRPTHKEERNYINKDKNYYVWFSWNQKYVFGENRLPEELENKFK